MKTVNDIRKAIKPLGFSLKTQALSWGTHATYKHIESGQSLSFNVFTPELLTRWKPLIDWIHAHKEELEAIREAEDVRGLKGV